MKKVCASFLILILAALLITGCEGFIPNPNEEYDEENTELAYLKVIPSQATMKVNQSKKFEVKAYNTEDNLIRIDVAEVKWVATYECLACGKVWKLSPTEGSLQTTFTPTNSEKLGSYEVWAKYMGEWAKADVEVN
ncbi:MAG: hypothetical protein XD85_0164 [Parcubacteria bacterium 34_609]|nr:MAG: hypothetical protein XD85_0164 [Parcubacteria bacterium 34_609]